MLERLIRAVAHIADGLAELSVVSVIVLTVIVTFGVVMRYAFNAALTWADEVASYSLLAMVFFGAAHTLNVDAHIRIDFFLNQLPARARNYVLLAGYGVGIVFAWLLILACWARFYNFWSHGTVDFTDLRTPLYLPAAPLMIGSVVFLAMMIAKTLQQLLLMTAQHHDPNP